MNPLIFLLNKFNDVVHIEPMAILVDLVYWLVILLVGFPLAAIVAVLRGLYLFVDYFVGASDLDPTATKNQEIAIFVTGCDSGFGKELVRPLTKRGYTVFAGCLHNESFALFQEDPLAIPIQVDVTSDKSVTIAFKTVSSWLAGGGNKKQRYFHALVNNAGLGSPCMIDWAAMSDFSTCIDVNYIGMVRCVKDFLPIFQKQAAVGEYNDARICNMVSMAGLFSGGDGATAYVASKHAADSFTDNLRLEMGAFGVHVTSVNPTFHKTPLACPDHMEVHLNKVWDNLTETTREEYGEAFFRAYAQFFQVLRYFSWRSENVIDAMEHSLVSKIPPRRLIVGMDAKYIFAPLNLLPTGLGVPAVRVRPAMMSKTN